MNDKDVEHLGPAAKVVRESGQRKQFPVYKLDVEYEVCVRLRVFV